ncbi:unnamed protein product [Calypogeia fissa]
MTSPPALQPVADALGLSVPVVQFLLWFLATLPVSWGWRLVPKGATQARHWYAAVTGAVVAHYALPPGSNWLLLVPVAMSYAAMVLWRRRCGQITFVLAFGFMLGCHVHFMSGESWKQGGIDATGALMVLTLKVISATMNYQDGLLTEGVDNLRPAQKKYRIFYLPNPITYLGYCFNCGSHLAGPVYELRSYIDWTANKDIWSSEDVPPYLLPALQAVAKTILCMGLYMYLSPHFTSSLFLARINQPRSGWQTFGFLWMCGFTARWKFYFIWSISEASLILSGLGFTGWDSGQEASSKQAKWDRARNVDIHRVEFSGSGSLIPLHWNIHVGFWLRHYVYEPLSGIGGMGRGGLVQLVGTQVISAVWHGLYIGYLLFFVHSALMIAGARVIYKWQLWMTSDVHTSTPRIFSFWVFGSKWELKVPRSSGMLSVVKQALGWAIGFSFASSILHYSWAGFLLLNLRDTLLAYHRMCYAGTILPVIVILFGKFVKPPQPYMRKGMKKTK